MTEEEERNSRAESNARTAKWLLAIIAVVVIFSAVTAVARGIVWIRWAFS